MGRYTIGPTLMGRHTKGLILHRRSTIGRVVNNTNSVTLQSVKYANGKRDTFSRK